MKFQYLGTAAAEGWPALFCECDHCERARTAGGKNIRKRSQAIIDDCLLIDFPMDAYANLALAGINGARIRACLVTHAHGDHFTPIDFHIIRPPYAHMKDKKIIQVYARSAAIKNFCKPDNPMPEDFNFHELQPYDVFEVETDSKQYTVTALPANHDPNSEPVNYIISDGEKVLFYAHDTGRFEEEIWNYLTEKKFRFDFVSLDCTNVLLPTSGRHMGIDGCIETKARMLETGLADENTVFCVNHFSHNGGLIYDEMVPVMAEHGMLVSHDGMINEI